MKFDDAIHSCKCGAYIRDESGTMEPGWKVMFLPHCQDGATLRYKQIGDFFAVNPTTGSDHRITFTVAMRNSDKWTTVL